MADNVIILGAGSSADAGIPLLGKFIETMWSMAKLGRHRNSPIPDSDRELIIQALKIRDELDGYHGRSAIDLWNIEEVLSLLAFTALTAGRAEKNKLDVMARAIARTIEITCRVKSNGKLNERVSGDIVVPEVYPAFWRSLFAWVRETNYAPPVIITFNYDLVLERSLLYSIIGTYFASNRAFPGDGICLDYHSKQFPQLKLALKSEEFVSQDRSNGIPAREGGFILEEISDQDTDLELLPIHLLKLHGSCNFPKPARKRQVERDAGQRLAEGLQDPLILPPVFNKATEKLGTGSWSFAMEALRDCKNLIVCGYSLPQTDIYMQYFLKAALGPNRDLDRIHVFDPILFQEERADEANTLKTRYAGNFSEPLRKRIHFQPPIMERSRGAAGTFNHLVWLLHKHPQTLLFG